MDITAVPPWLGTAIAGGIAAVIGFAGKAIIESRKQVAAKKEESLQRLKRLAALLQQSQSIFVDQNNLVRRLNAQIVARLGNNIEMARGFDETFYSSYDKLIPDERELLSIIRGTTMNSLRTVNEHLAVWLSDDSSFKLYDGPDEHLSELAIKLKILDRHLALWHDKYKSVLLPDPKRSLVYLGDEKAQGVPFPHGIEEVVQSAISKCSA